MKTKCDYCGNYINDTDERCPNCNGVNSHLIRNANGVPRTIEELKQWCQAKNIPLEQARFFIGVDYRGARAFGIYHDETTGNFVVYKNKSDGSRAIRYEGKDEVYAVNELYQKLKEEIVNQKQHLNQNQRPNYTYGNTFHKKKSSLISRYVTITIIICFAVITLFNSLHHGPKRGYYEYDSIMYYYQPGDGWYSYDDGDWYSTSVDYALEDNYDDYYSSRSYESQYEASDFSDSYYYDADSGNSSNDDWDSDSGWDSGDSWDSGYSDWDSDW